MNEKEKQIVFSVKIPISLRNAFTSYARGNRRTIRQMFMIMLEDFLKDKG